MLGRKYEKRGMDFPQRIVKECAHTVVNQNKDWNNERAIICEKDIRKAWSERAKCDKVVMEKDQQSIAINIEDTLCFLGM